MRTRTAITFGDSYNCGSISSVSRVGGRFNNVFCIPGGGPCWLNWSGTISASNGLDLGVGFAFITFLVIIPTVILIATFAFVLAWVGI